RPAIAHRDAHALAGTGAVSGYETWRWYRAESLLPDCDGRGLWRADGAGSTACDQRTVPRDSAREARSGAVVLQTWCHGEGRDPQRWRGHDGGADQALDRGIHQVPTWSDVLDGGESLRHGRTGIDRREGRHRALRPGGAASRARAVPKEVRV